MFENSPLSLVFVVWFVLCLVKQLRLRAMQWMVDLDFGRLIPFYAFFVDPFGVVVFTYRDVYQNGSESRWVDLSLTRPPGLVGMFGHAIFSRATVLLHYGRRIEKQLLAGATMADLDQVPEFRAVIDLVSRQPIKGDVVRRELELWKLEGVTKTERVGMFPTVSVSLPSGTVQQS